MPSSRPASSASLRTAGALAILGLLASPALVACGSDGATTGAQTIKVSAGDTSCDLSISTIAAGVTRFEAKNVGGKVTEVYVYRPDESIVAEKENIGPGTSATFTADLSAGEYQVACKPGQKGDGIRKALKVTGGAAPATTSAAAVAAVKEYRTWVADQVDASKPQVVAFVAAVKAGDVAKAKSLYAPSRVGWESVEPVAEAFGDLDPEMDAREGDVPPGAEWTGWHRIEKALWAQKTTKGMGTYADRLLKEYNELIERIPAAPITVSSIGNGAKELLDEVATGKITGEEEQYSRTDLVDFQANVNGARKAFEVLTPLVKAKDPALVTQLDEEFAAVDAALAKHGSGTDFTPYNKLTKAEIAALAASVDALAEPLSRLTSAAV